ncbi:MAG: ArsR/SmtB family transcription factor [Candidatus Saccharimonadales bacterium]|jgi:DNA-binding transcriptional ArsR family regulator
MLNNHSVKYDLPTDTLSLLFMALADPTRRQILELLHLQDMTVSDIAKHFPVSLPAISKHLKVLEHAGLISRTRHAQWRPCRLEARSLMEGASYMDQYRDVWETSLMNLGNYIQKLKGDQRGEK